MPLAIIQAVIQLATYIVGWIVTKKLNDKELRAAFEQFAELARSENIKTIVKRQKAEEQIKSANKKWDEIEEKERALEKTLESGKK